MTGQDTIRVLSVVHHPLFREGIAAVIKSQPDMQLVAEAATASEAFQQFRKHQPDVTLMDLRLPDATGIAAMTAIRAHFPDARVILLINFEGDLALQEALHAGAWGCMPKTKPPKEIVDAIRGTWSSRTKLQNNSHDRPLARAQSLPS